jgi:hypothetical protein
MLVGRLPRINSRPLNRPHDHRLLEIQITCRCHRDLGWSGDMDVMALHDLVCRIKPIDQRVCIFAGWGCRVSVSQPRESDIRSIRDSCQPYAPSKPPGGGTRDICATTSSHFGVGRLPTDRSSAAHGQHGASCLRHNPVGRRISEVGRRGKPPACGAHP